MSFRKPNLSSGMINEARRLDFAVIPGEHQGRALIEASQEITRRMHNDNIIDATRFPPHLSLHIASVPTAGLEQLWDAFEPDNLTLDLTPALVPVAVSRGTGGYVSLAVEIGVELRALHEHVLEVVAEQRAGIRVEYPHWFDDASNAERDRYARYGGVYVLDKFDAHFSIAKVRYDDQDSAIKLATARLAELRPERASAFEVCDIGSHSEKWEVLFSTLAP